MTESIEFFCSTCKHHLPSERFFGTKPGKVYKTCISCRNQCKDLMREKNIDTVENPKITIKCECGGSYLLSRKEKHIKGMKHLTYSVKVPSEGLSSDMTRCKCGGEFNTMGIMQHLKTKKHKKYLDQEEIED